ncbi:DUF4142 domain-containing protein [Dyella jejuensis]|uniref:DUF4142 domain-containing protein n=1 Tax=Dyella jejuensis TaxID=1432009 RepID=A0ABW8JKG7_9GAMM
MSNRNRYGTLAGAWLLAVASAGLVQAGTAAPGDGKLGDEDSSFLRQAAQDGMAMAQLGQLALQRSSDPKVKQLAQQLVDDQGKNSEQFKTLAQRKHVTLPTTLGADAQKQDKSLQAKQGSAFDEAWSKAVADDQKKTVKAFTQESKQAKDADVKQFAQDNVAALNRRMQTAQQLAEIPQARDQAMDDAMKAASSPMSTPTAGMSGASATTTPAEAGATSALRH